MKAGSRPQYYRIRRVVQMVREGTKTGYLPNSSDFVAEFGISRRTVSRDLDFLRIPVHIGHPIRNLVGRVNGAKRRW